jgi:S1-C subfamily serine protease
MHGRCHIADDCGMSASGKDMSMSDEARGAALGVSDALADAVERAAHFTVRVDGRGRLASSGIIWADGVILSANHTIERDDDITVMLPDGTTVPATIAGRDPGSDIAVLRVRVPLPAATRAEQVRVGMLALAVGRPGRDGVGAALGVVSAIGAPWRSRGHGGRGGRGGTALEQLMRADVTMYPGFSGGPLIDLTGAVLGMNTSGMGGNAFTIPCAVAEPIISQLLEHGRLKRGYLGLTSQPIGLPDALAEAAGQATGLLVVGVEEGSPAAIASTIVGDILIGIGANAIRDTDDLREALGSEQAGQATTLRIIRGGELRELDVTIGER